jgi:hypothetical protein
MFTILGSWQKAGEHNKTRIRESSILFIIDGCCGNIANVFAKMGDIRTPSSTHPEDAALFGPLSAARKEGYFFICRPKKAYRSNFIIAPLFAPQAERGVGGESTRIKLYPTALCSRRKGAFLTYKNSPLCTAGRERGWGESTRMQLYPTAFLI